MKIPSYITLLLITALLGLGCSTVGGFVAPFVNGSVSARVVIGILLFIPTYKALLSWHRIVWEAQHAR